MTGTSDPAHPPGEQAPSAVVVRSARRRRVLSFGVWSVSMLAAALILVNAGDVDLQTSLGNVATLLFVFVGAILVVRLPSNRVGWLLWAAGLLVAAFLGARGLAVHGLTATPPIPGAIWLAWLSAWIGVPAVFIALGFLPLVYPTGHLLSRRWRAVAAAGLVAMVTAMLQGALGPLIGPWPPGTQNPLLLDGPAGAALQLFDGLMVAFVGAGFAVAAAISVVLRFRRAEGIERQQVKWLAAIATIVAVAFIAVLLTGSSLAWLVLVASLDLLPVAIGLAVLRYRLYDLDLVIHRTAVYLPLTAALAGVFAASTAVLQRLFVEVTGGPSDGAIILSTLLIAAIFAPIRDLVQGIVDRRFRDSPDIERLLATFVTSVDEAMWQPDAARVMRAFLQVASRTPGVGGGGAYVIAANGERLVGHTANRGQEIRLAIPVVVDGRPIGHLELDAGSRPLSDRDAGILRAAGENLGAALADREMT
jgi:cytochrome b subunit of formate dehydrogenase